MDTNIFMEWNLLYRQYKNGYHLSNEDIRELVRLNHLIMEAVHDVHNEHMLGVLKFK